MFFTKTDSVRINQTFLQIDEMVTIVDSGFLVGFAGRPDDPQVFPTTNVGVGSSGHLEVLRNGIDQTVGIDYDLSLNPPGVVFRIPVSAGDIIKTRLWRG